MKDKWSNAMYEVVCQCSDSPMYVVKGKKGYENKYHCNHLLFIASLGTDSDAKPLAELLAAVIIALMSLTLNARMLPQFVMKNTLRLVRSQK